MEMTVTNEADGAVFTLIGRLDTTTSPLLEKDLLPVLGESRNVVLDFAGVSYVSSAGLRTLLIGQKTALKNSVQMRLRGVTSDVLEILKMTGFDSLIAIIP